MGFRLGVDLGTTWTAAAIGTQTEVQALQLGTRSIAMPSVVALDGDDMVVGEAADRRLAADPTSGVREAKRRLGDQTPFVLGGTPYGPEALMGALLQHVVSVATDQQGAKPDQVVLTHPANWGEYKLELLREAARIAGVSQVELLGEPHAAALHYVRLGRVDPGSIVAVHDFGGGTFDAAVVRARSEGPELLGAAEGLERLGGVDLDQAVLAHVDDALGGQLRELDGSDPEVRRGVARLRADVITAKEALSSDAEVTIPVVLPNLVTEVRLTRGEFEAAIRARISDTLAALDRAVASADINVGELVGVLLVGGSSRIPAVAEAVAGHTGVPVLVDADPKLVVPFGAAGDRDAVGGALGVDAAAAPTDAAAGLVIVAGGDAGASRAGESGAMSPMAAAGGLVALGGLTAAGVYAARSMGDEQEAAEQERVVAAATMLDEQQPAPAPAAASMDVFDHLATDAREAASPAVRHVQAAPATAVAAPSPVAPPPVAAPPPAPSTATAAPPQQPVLPPAPDLDDVRSVLLARTEALEPPDGVSPGLWADLEEDLHDLITSYRPIPGASREEAIRELRHDFEDRLRDFEQDQEIELLREQLAQPDIDAERAALLAQLDRMHRPGELDDAAWAALQEDLRDTIEHYHPAPGMSEDDAVWHLQWMVQSRLRDVEVAPSGAPTQPEPTPDETTGAGEDDATAAGPDDRAPAEPQPPDAPEEGGPEPAAEAGSGDPLAGVIDAHIAHYGDLYDVYVAGFRPSTDPLDLVKADSALAEWAKRDRTAENFRHALEMTRPDVEASWPAVERQLRDAPQLVDDETHQRIVDQLVDKTRADHFKTVRALEKELESAEEAVALAHDEYVDAMAMVKPRSREDFIEWVLADEAAMEEAEAAWQATQPQQQGAAEHAADEQAATQAASVEDDALGADAYRAVYESADTAADTAGAQPSDDGAQQPWASGPAEVPSQPDPFDADEFAATMFGGDTDLEPPVTDDHGDLEDDVHDDVDDPFDDPTV